jgi:hypothetical protein
VKSLHFLDHAHVICLHAGKAIYAYRRWGRPVSARTPQHSLAAKTAGTLVFALIAWTALCNLSPAFISGDLSRAVLERQVHQIHASVSHAPHSRAMGSSFRLDVSATTIFETTSEEPSPAESIHLAQLPESTPIIARCSVSNSVPQKRIIRTPAPDHLIELPGTPPPSFV